jgi:phage FluMu protein Com
MITINEKNYRELRCHSCRKFICYENIAAGIICYQCPRCGFLNEFNFRYLKTRENLSKIENIITGKEVKKENG